MTNRALVLAALAAGPAMIRNPLRARDTELMAAAVRALGAEVAANDGAANDNGGSRPVPCWLVTPVARGARRLRASHRAALGQRTGERRRRPRRVTVDVGNAGTVLRFVPPVAALTTADARLPR